MSFEPTPTWRPLGEVIVERGLITQEQLEDALLEQRRTQKRLGTILVDKGIVSAQDLTDALVDQIGVEELMGELQDSPEPAGGRGSAPSVTQPFRRLGSRLGSRRSGSGRRDDQAPVAPFALSPAFDSDEAFEPFRTEEVEPDPKPEVEEPDEEHPLTWLAAARAAFETAEVEIGRLDDLLTARSHELGEARAQLAEREAEIASLHALIDERDAGLTTLEATIEELRQAVIVTQGQLAEARKQAEVLTGQLEADKAELAQRTARVAELEKELGVVVADRHGREPATAPVPPEPLTPRAAPEPKTDGFVCFLPRPGEGYGLVERPGAAPAVGETIEVEGTRYEVTRHSRSPMPFDRRTCVYLRQVD